MVFGLKVIHEERNSEFVLRIQSVEKDALGSGRLGVGTALASAGLVSSLS